MISSARLRLISLLGHPYAVQPVRPVYTGLVPFAGAHGRQHVARVVQVMLGVRLVREGQLQSFRQRQGHLGARAAGQYGHELQGDDLAVGPVLGLALPALAARGSGIASAFLHRIFRTSAGLRTAFDSARLSLQNGGGGRSAV